MSLETFPRYSEINEHMKRISGRVCSCCCCSNENVNRHIDYYNCRIAAYDFTGCDYALVLFASFPSNCVNLQQLNWSLEPLPGQENTNLLIFCEAALSLHLPNTPKSSLTPYRLQRNVANTLYHMQVQHWLCTLGERFPPLANFNPYITRSWLRWKQTNEPFIVETTFNELFSQDRLHETLSWEETGATTSRHHHTITSNTMCIPRLLMNDRQTACNALTKIPPLTRDVLNKAAPFLMYIPEEKSDVLIKELAHNELANSSKTNTFTNTSSVSFTKKGKDNVDKKVLCKDKLESEKYDDSSSAPGKEPRSRDYAKPWRQASLPTSKPSNTHNNMKSVTASCTTRNASSANKKRAREEQQPNSTLCPCSYLTAYLPLAHNLHEQCVYAQREVAMLHSRLENCFSLFYRQLLSVGEDSGTNVIEYDVIAKQLQEIDLGNSQIIM